MQVDGLRKVYGDLVAVDGLSFGIADGEIFGMAGPNRAGKTTTIECLEGLRKPDGGTLRLPAARRLASRQRVGTRSTCTPPSTQIQPIGSN